jgi:hypothetical protein
MSCHSLARARRAALSALLLPVLLLPFAACSDLDDVNGPSSGSGWRDLGAIPGISHALSLVVVGDTVYVGTSHGVFARRLDGAGSWGLVGLPGLDVQVLRVVRMPDPILLAGGRPMQPGVSSFYRSGDGATTWTSVASGLTHYQSGEPIPVADLAVRPAAPGGQPELYANMSGLSLARSTDLGATWSYVYGSPDWYATYDCVVHVIPEQPSRLYQGCEAPLDDAWIRRFDLGTSAEFALGEGQRIVEDISNRRINAFWSFTADPGALYAGVEGGLLRVAPGGQWRWIYEVPPNGNRLYTYVRFVWVDPRDARHLVFGGGVRAEESGREGLHETFDGGATTHIMDGPPGVVFTRAAVPAGAVLDGSRGMYAILVADGARWRVLVRMP